MLCVLCTYTCLSVWVKWVWWCIINKYFCLFIYFTCTHITGIQRIIHTRVSAKKDRFLSYFFSLKKYIFVFLCRFLFVHSFASRTHPHCNVLENIQKYKLIKKLSVFSCLLYAYNNELNMSSRLGANKFRRVVWMFWIRANMINMKVIFNPICYLYNERQSFLSIQKKVIFKV